MKELDLHGLFHHQVKDKVENFILLNARNLPVRIIIGNSSHMRWLTEDILIKHNFDYYVPSYNVGEIIVVYDKEHTLCNL